VDQARIYRNLSLLNDYPVFNGVHIGIKELSHQVKGIVHFLETHPREKAYWSGQLSGHDWETK
jgi:hypothetical protein